LTVEGLNRDYPDFLPAGMGQLTETGVIWGYSRLGWSGFASPIRPGERLVNPRPGRLDNPPAARDSHSSRSGVLGELRPIQLGVEAAARDEVLVRAGLGHTAVLQHQDLVRPSHRR